MPSRYPGQGNPCTPEITAPTTRPGGGALARAVRDRAIVETLYSSGLRVSELVGLAWRDIDEELAMVTVRAGKGNKDRVVPIGEPALDALYQSLSPEQKALLDRQRGHFGNHQGGGGPMGHRDMAHG